MARPARTYRHARRNDWRKLNGVTWQEHNERNRLRSDEWMVGTFPCFTIAAHIARSKYNPHIGAKERARYA